MRATLEVCVREKLWTWGGTYFGYREGVKLWTYDGRNVGKFRGNAVFEVDGSYLGEIKNGKLITSKSKTSRGSSFSPSGDHVGEVPTVDRVGTVMLAGYEDFPGPEEF